MPKKGGRIKINLFLNTEKIISVNINVLNENNNFSVIKNQFDLISNKNLFKWKFENHHLIIERPVSVKKLYKIMLC